jgi:hypothetical protein
MKNSKQLNRVLWIAAVVLTISLVVYQRATGPTYPKKGEVEIAGETVKFKLLRTHDTDIDAPVEIKVASKKIKGELSYKRFKSYDEWTTIPLKRSGDMLMGQLPFQPPAGKIEYKVRLVTADESVDLTEEPVVIRFKGAVPAAILTPHIFFMFISLLFTLRAGLEALFRRKDTLYLTGVSLVTLVIGGLILGPIVQKYAFDAYWTGWPFGHDLTDNKTAVIFIFLLIAFLKLRKDPGHKTWVVVATVVMVVVYAIPHSVLGSEIDHTKSTIEQTE